MENPWKEINLENRVLLKDKAILELFYQKRGKYLLSEVELPEPFIGNPNAPIYMLMGSPGLGSSTLNFIDIHSKLEEEKSDLLKTTLNSDIISNLHLDFSKLDYPFFSLNPKFKSSIHYSWWYRVFLPIVKKLHKTENIKELELIKAISNSFFNIELYGYHSVVTEKCFLKGKYRLPSIDYSIYLIKKAMEENKLILIPRAVSQWFSLVPELKNYDNAHFVATNRIIELSSTTISPIAYKIINQQILNNIEMANA